MITRSLRINPLLAAVGVLLLVVLAVSLAHSETGSSPPDHDPARGGFHIQGTNLGVFLVDSRTGDTWKWFYNHEEGSMGWQYHAVPAPIGGNTLQGQMEFMDRQGSLIDTQRGVIEKQSETIEGQQELISTFEERIQQLQAGCP